ncbi:ATP/GTP-binding protein [Armatimonas sp.]|uniref:AAA family ATPase n=1 Tax=Armatimonas sp. TaxID=1872638 RepID=UPI0037501680
MLIQFTVGNFLSFREKTTFSMVASPDEPGHQDRVVKINDNLSVLRVAAIYGANASGKSNLLKAMAFAQRLIINGTQVGENIQNSPFLLDQETQEKPSEFEFVFLINNHPICYGFICDNNSILHEWLKDASSDEVIFDRKNTEIKTEISITVINASFLGSSPDRLQFIKEGTRSNQLFLTEAAERNVSYPLEIVEWFQMGISISLEAFKPPENFNRLTQNFFDTLGSFLRTADTGIKEINLFRDPISGAASLQAIHGKDSVSFSPEQESEGTRRLINLWPITFTSFHTPLALSIDEIDQSLHPEIFRYFIEDWIQNSRNQSQLIFTTHNDNLLEDDLLRRDEVWLVTKNKEGASELASLVEYKIEPGTNLQKAYLHGWFNGVPRLGARRFYHTIREEGNDADSAA